MTRVAIDPNAVIEKLIETLDVPPSHYQRAVERYQSIGEWLQRPDSTIVRFAPEVYAQGSFRLGTVTRPIVPADEYDLDCVCELKRLGKHVVTQQVLKTLVGEELRLYRTAYGIEEALKERNRCWRLEYADHLNFHIDNLPCIPEDPQVIAALIRAGVEPAFAAESIALTCRTHKDYAVISPLWPMSNPGGYARWFEGRFATFAASRRKQILAEGVYKAVEKIPLYALKSPLQRAIQFLKRHRDVMFRNDTEHKPISIIITTLAALAYRGEEQLFAAIDGILRRMPEYVNQGVPRIPNPVNPGEDFADKWKNAPVLEQNFWAWQAQALRDLVAVTSSTDPTRLQTLAEDRFGITVSREHAGALAGTSGVIAAVSVPSIVVTRPPKPWGHG